MMFRDSIFATIALGTRERVRCSPRMPAGFVGIRVGSHAEVPTDAGRIPLCGTYLLPTMDVPTDAELVDSMQIVARRLDGDDPSNEDVLSMLVGPPVEPMPIEAIADPVEPSPDTLVGGHFNVDLLPLLGTEAGEYGVYVELGPHRSKERVLRLVSLP